MQVKNFWVGDRPAGTWTFQVLDQRTGAVQSLVGYTATVLLLDPKNKPVVIPDGSAIVTNPDAGQVTFVWPQDSLFSTPGRYVMQLQLDSGTSTRRTTEQEILVRALGGVIN